MKIAVVVLEFPSLNETFILDHITGLIDRGHDVDIYATAPNELKIHDEIERYDLLARTIYRDSKKFTLPNLPALRVLKGVPMLAAGLLRNPRAVFNSLNVLRLGREASSLTALCKVAPFLRSSTYDIIHCHFLQNGKLAVTLRELGALKGKIVTSIHGYGRPIFEKAESPRQHLFTGLFMKGDLFLVCSEHMKRWFNEKGCDQDKMMVHRYGIHFERFNVSNRKLADDGVRLLSVGRLVEKKGLEYAIRAVAEILRRFPSVRYEIVGDGPERPKLENLIIELGVGRSVKLVGPQVREEVLQLLARADMFLAPSVTSRQQDQEGIPLVVHEAMAAGLAVISTYHTGIPELVRDGETGFLVAEKDVAGIVKRLSQLIENRELCHRMGQKAREHIQLNNNLKMQNDRLIAIYKGLLEKRLAGDRLPHITSYVQPPV